MKFTGYAATYSPTSKKNTNKHNYYMNGIIKDVIAESCCADICEFSKMRSLYAIADGSMSECEGEAAAYLCMDMMNNMSDADFTKAYANYFDSANRVVQSRAFSNNGASMSMDIGVLYLYQNIANIFNFGNVSIYHKSDNSFTEVSGSVPQNIEVDKVVKKNGELFVKKIIRKNTPNIGYISEDLAVIPYKSKPIRLKDNDSLFMATQSLMATLSKNEIITVLNSDSIPQDEKATTIVGKAVEKNPEGNYTIVYVAKKLRKPIPKLSIKLITLIIAAVLAVVGAFGLFQGAFVNGSETENGTEVDLSISENEVNDLTDVKDKEEKNPEAETESQQQPVVQSVQNHAPKTVQSEVSKTTPSATVVQKPNNTESEVKTEEKVEEPNVTIPAEQEKDTDGTNNEATLTNPESSVTPEVKDEPTVPQPQTQQNIKDIISTW